MSIAETIVLGSIAFFASAISDINKVIHSDYIVFFRTLFDFTFLSDPTGFILCLSIIVVFLVGFKNLFQAIVNYWRIRFASLVEGLLAGKLISGFLNLPYEWHLSQNSADLVLVSANWRGYIGRRIISNCLQVIADCLLVVIMLSTLLIVQPIVSLIVITILGTTSFIIFTSVRKKLDKVSLINSDYDQSINKQATKMIHGFKDVKISGKQNIFINQYHNTLYLVSKNYGKQQVIATLPSWLLETMGFFMISFAICFMLFFLNYSVARVSGTITLLAVTAWRVLPALNRILTQLTHIKSTIPYIDKILEYYKQIQLYEKNALSVQIKREKKNIDFLYEIRLKKVFFKYQNTKKYALKDISLTIKKGSVVGIIGASGAGKSTFVDLLTGLLLPTYGQILIDENNLDNDYLRMLWMTKLGYVPQTPYIFDGTIAENIAFEIDENNIIKNRVLECCQMAAMNDFLTDLHSGIDTYIGERGVRLSGGQRQRVSIARTLYQEPELIIFDEATSSLDSVNEKSIQDTIYSLRGKQTMVIIAHRLTTVESCDIIYEFENGVIKTMGTPQEILKL